MELFLAPEAPVRPISEPSARTLTHSDVGFHCPLAEALDSRRCSRHACSGSWSQGRDGSEGWKERVQSGDRGGRGSPASQSLPQPGIQEATKPPYWLLPVGGSLPAEGTAQPSTLCPGPQALPDPAQPDDRFRARG